LTKAGGGRDTLPHGLVERTVEEHVVRIWIDSQSGHNGPVCLLAGQSSSRQE
jgi:hypothetical protein